MKKVILSLALVATITGLSVSPQAAHAQGQPAPIPHKVGLIDMAHIFKNYHKFNDRREALKKEIESSDKKARAMLIKLQELDKKVKSKEFGNTSPQKKQWRNELIQATTAYQQFRTEEQTKFLEKESGIYKDIYIEVSDAVRVYAEFYKYTLVLRWNRSGVESAKDAKSILGGMNRLVIYARQGNDITDRILDHLNKQYNNSANKGGSTRR